MKLFGKVIDKICFVSGIVSAASMAFIMLWMFYDLCRRILLDAPMTGGYEVTCMVMSILTFASWSYAQSKHGHIHVTMFINMMPDKAKNILFAITSWISTFTLGIMTYASFTYAITMKKVSAMLLVPYKPFVFIMSICAFAFALALLSDAVKATLAIRNEELAKEIASELS